MAFQPPQSRGLQKIQTAKRNVPLDQIIAVEGQNPLGTGIETFGKILGDSLTKRAALRAQGEQLAQLAAMAGEKVPQTNTLTPDMFQQGLALKEKRQAKMADIAEKRAALELKVQQFRKGTTIIDQATGKTEVVPPIQGIRIGDDENGYPKLIMDEAYTPPTDVKVTSGSPGVRGSIQQSTFADPADGSPLLFDRDNKSYIRSDGKPFSGIPVPLKGNKEAATESSRGAVILGAVNNLEDKFSKMKELSIRTSLTPVAGAVIFPEIKQLRSELEQAGFAFGGKSYTGSEKNIIVGAMIPGPLDNPASRKAKFQAIREYTNGNIDLLQAANLLGASGNAIKDILGKNRSLNPLPVKRFKSEQEAESANLPDGTPIEINGVAGTWRSH